MTLMEVGRINLSLRAERIRPSGTKAMTARAAKLQAAGRPVITLSQGELDFDTPSSIRSAAIAAIQDGKTRYTPVAGDAPLRDAIRKKLRDENGLDYYDENITVGCGAKQVLFNALFATLDPGDEVIIPTPCWVSYPDMVELASGRPVLVRGEPDNSFKLSPSALEDAITPRTRWLMLNSPCNPTGAVYNIDELRALGEVLERHPDVLILSDDIYEKLVYGSARFASFASVSDALKQRTLVVNGVSKANAMTGWRVGYGAGPATLISAINKIQGQTTSHTSSISQYAALEALTGDSSYIDGFVESLIERRKLVADGINQAKGLSCDLPDGAFYIFASCEGVIGRRTPDGRKIESDTDFADFLLNSAEVAVVPGSEFLESPRIRISYAASTDSLREACRRIIAACNSLT